MSDRDTDPGAQPRGVLPSRREHDAAGAASVDTEVVLDRLDALDVREWEHTGEGGARHLGPAAEEFHDVFGLGEDADRIAAGDADGVALAAIQGLTGRLDEQGALIERQARRLDEQRGTIDEQRDDLETLRERLESLQTEVARLRRGVGGRD